MISQSDLAAISGKDSSKKLTPSSIVPMRGMSQIGQWLVDEVKRLAGVIDEIKLTLGTLFLTSSYRDQVGGMVNEVGLTMTGNCFGSGGGVRVENEVCG